MPFIVKVGLTATSFSESLRRHPLPVLWMDSIVTFSLAAQRVKMQHWATLTMLSISCLWVRNYQRAEECGVAASMETEIPPPL